MPAGRPSKHARSPFGARLHLARQQAGLSQLQVAGVLGVTQPSYADWERRSVALKPEYLPKLAEMLGVSVDYLVGKEPAKRPPAAPAGRARQVFDAVLKLPRKQQAKVVKWPRASWHCTPSPVDRRGRPACGATAPLRPIPHYPGLSQVAGLNKTKL